MNNKRLIFAIGEIDDKYIQEAESKMKRTSLVGVAVCFVLVIALSLYLFIPFAPVTSDLSAYADSSYFPLIEGIEDYRLSFVQPIYKNNFQALAAGFAGLLGGFGKSQMGGDMAPMDSGMNDSSAPEMNGSYIEVTDNQVAGVIESDLFKMTNEYLFRIGYKTVYSEPLGKYDKYSMVLRVYSVDKENSKLISEFDIPTFEGEKYSSGEEMYLSSDATTVTILKEYTDENSNSHIGVISLDVGNVEKIAVKGKVSIEGSLNTSRMVEGKLLLITEFYFNRNDLDYDDPSTFVPTIDSGSGAKAVEFQDIIFPDEVGNTRYSVVALMDSDDLSLLGANALLNFTSDVYISQNNVFITREYTEKENGQNGNEFVTKNMSDIAVLNYSGEDLEKRGIITVRGHAEDQYSFDELEGYLRVVTSTSDGYQQENNNGTVGFRIKENVSLYIFDLKDNSLAYSVEDFAIEGEEATAVRFDGNKLYVCTAVVVNFTDPVYFFDLSDYENITFSDTGVIEGYSDHLINLGEGFTLGIGPENWQYNKVEVYEQQGDSVVSVDKYMFDGDYSTDYKSYLVNREENLFGFGVDNFTDYDEQTGKYIYSQRYVLLRFNGYAFVAVTFDVDGMSSDTVRAAYLDGYLYITTPYGLTVERIN